MSKYTYDLALIGGGPVGLVAAKLAKGLGKKVVLIEKKHIGGARTNTGCIPSKTLIRSAQVAYDMQHAARWGLASCDQKNIDTKCVMEHVRGVIKSIYETHTPDKIRETGIDVIEGAASFVNNHTLKINDKIITARSIIIATGSTPLIPPIQGLKDVPYLTNENFFEQAELPSSMAIVGGGPIGVELASACNRLGVTVTVIEAGSQILSHDDPELVALLTEELSKEGITVLTQTRVEQVSVHENGIKLICKDATGNIRQVVAQKLLIAVGRAPALSDLHLENAGVVYTKKRITVDPYLRTTAKNIYACGDIVGPYHFSHTAEYQASVATRNALVPLFKKRVDYSYVPWVTFCSPELAHAGLTEDEARKKYGDHIHIYRKEYEVIHRARIEGKQVGLAKFICDSRGYIVGAHIFGARAGEIIHEVQLGRYYGYRLADFDAMSQVQDDTLSMADHLYVMFKGPQLMMYTFLKDVSCENAAVTVQDPDRQRFFNLQFDCKVKKIDNTLKSSIDLFGGALTAHDRELFKHISGSLQFDSYDGQPTTDVCVKGAASFEIPQLGQEIMPCYVSGSWHHNRGSFSLKNVDHSFAIDPILIRKEGGILHASVEAKLPVSYIVHMCTNENNDYRLQGNCSVQAKMQLLPNEVRYNGNIMVRRLFWGDTEIGSLAKMTFEKKDDTVVGGLYLQRTSGACFGGAWSCFAQEGVLQADMKNNARLTFSPKHDWQIFPEDLSVRVERTATGTYSLAYEGKATHVKAQHQISSSGTVTLEGERFLAKGSLDDHTYILNAHCADEFVLDTFKYESPHNEELVDINRDEQGQYAGFVHVHCVKDLLKKHLHHDLQGEGLFNLAIRPENNTYFVNVHLQEGTIRLPRTYNFLSGFDCDLLIKPQEKKCIVSDLLCTLHNGSMSSKKMEIALADDLSPRFVYAPILIDHCLLNIEKELFAVISGSMLLSKRQDAGTRLTGTIIIDRAQLKENLFSEVFQKNMRSITAYSFDTRDDDMQCDIAVKTKYPVRVQTPFLQTDARIDLHIRNKIRDPQVIGSIHLAGGELHFPYKPLESQINFASPTCLPSMRARCMTSYSFL